MLEFNIRNQEISRIDNFSPAEKSVEYLIAKFNFKTEDWNEAIKRAIFRNVKSKVEKDTMIEDDSCIVPWEVLEGSGAIEISVHGVIGTKEITSDVAVFNLDRTLSGGSASEKPTPTVYEQMLKVMQETKDIAQSVRNDADNGAFDGEKGDKGDAGAIHFVVVNELPQENIDESAIYLVPIALKGENNEYAEYIYVNGHWEYIGSATVEVDLSEYVKKDDYATRDKLGLVYANPVRGISVTTDGGLILSPAGEDEVDNRAYYKAISASILDYAVKKALSDCKLSGDDVWTDEEKAKALELLGVVISLAATFNSVPVRDKTGNIYSQMPKDDWHCANKKYVDDLVGSVESILTELHTYAQTKIGGEA